MSDLHLKWEQLIAVAEARLRHLQEMVQLAEVEIEELRRLAGSGDYQSQQWISVPEFIKRTKNGISPSLVYDMLSRGELAGIRVSERKWMIRADALDILRAEQRTKPARDRAQDS